MGIYHPKGMEVYIDFAITSFFTCAKLKFNLAQFKFKDIVQGFP